MKFTPSYYSLDEWVKAIEVDPTPETLKLETIEDGKLVELWFPNESLPNGLIYKVELAGKKPVFQRAGRNRIHEHSVIVSFHEPCVVYTSVSFEPKQVSSTRNLPEQREIAYVCLSEAQLEALRRAAQELKKLRPTTLGSTYTPRQNDLRHGPRKRGKR